MQTVIIIILLIAFVCAVLIYESRIHYLRKRARVNKALSDRYRNRAAFASILEHKCITLEEQNLRLENKNLQLESHFKSFVIEQQNNPRSQ